MVNNSNFYNLSSNSLFYTKEGSPKEEAIFEEFDNITELHQNLPSKIDINRIATLDKNGNFSVSPELYSRINGRNIVILDHGKKRSLEGRVTVRTAEQTAELSRFINNYMNSLLEQKKREKEEKAKRTGALESRLAQRKVQKDSEGEPIKEAIKILKEIVKEEGEEQFHKEKAREVNRTITSLINEKEYKKEAREEEKYIKSLAEKTITYGTKKP